jgi:site-specific DNA recombinase
LPESPQEGTCGNGRTIRRDDIERRALNGLTDKLVSPEAVADAVRTYVEETNRQNHEWRAQAEADHRALEKIERGIRGMMAAIEDGMYQPAMKARMGDLEQQKAIIEVRLSQVPADVPDIHPNIAELYRAKVVRLTETLAEPGANSEVREDIRSLVGEVAVMPGEKRGESRAILRGELMGILDRVSGRRRSPRPEVITKVVACPRNKRYLYQNLHRYASRIIILPKGLRGSPNSRHQSLCLSYTVRLADSVSYKVCKRAHVLIDTCSV